MATASRPALAAPDGPSATVAPGTPFGIWTMESSESRPLSAALCTGTPMTGSTVCDATIPGRCAAPPAPAMITCSPRSAAVDAYSAIHAGVRCAETTWHSCGIPNSVRIASAWLIVSQSDLLPMMTPTSRGWGLGAGDWGDRSSGTRVFYLSLASSVLLCVLRAPESYHPGMTRAAVLLLLALAAPA